MPCRQAAFGSRSRDSGISYAGKTQSIAWSEQAHYEAPGSRGREWGPHPWNPWCGDGCHGMAYWRYPGCDTKGHGNTSAESAQVSLASEASSMIMFLD